MIPRHVFVLMLENRSFDHFFGQSGLPGVPAPDLTHWRTTADAPDRIGRDLGHELDDVAAQLRTAGSVPMKGFEEVRGAADAMAGFGAMGVPVVRTLAREFLLFDNWFSSMPGPTWPNRFFVHAASSGGLTNSPGDISSLGAISVSSLAFSFEHGSIFDRFNAAGRSWRVYHAGPFPQVLAVDGMVQKYSGSRWFRSLDVGSRLDAFASDLRHGDAADYAFLEPDHGIPFGNGDSQHAPFSVAKGERLIKYVYETLRGSPIWSDSALLVTWDEHGGFFDHVEPPTATPPGDAPINHGREKEKRSAFDFTRLGVRVPCLLISPRVAQGGLGSQLFPAARFDHSSVVRVLRDVFTPDAPALTQRDARAPSWLSAIGEELRADCPQLLPDPQVTARTQTELARDGSLASEPLPSESTVDGYLLIARAVDLSLSEQGVLPHPIADEHPALVHQSIVLQRSLGSKDRTAPLGEPVAAMTVAQKLSYIQQVGQTALRAKATP